MKKNIKFRLLDLRNARLLLALSGGLLLASCSAQVGAYSENDGVYYDPATDTLPEGVISGDENQVGDTYDYGKASVIDKSQANENLKKNKYKNWSKNTSSDWGTYNGTEYNYNSSFSPFGYGLMVAPGFGMSFGTSFGYGSMFGYSRYGWYSPYSYNPYFYGYGYPYYLSYYYSPFDDYYAYNPYRYGAYYYGTPMQVRRSGSDGRMSNGSYNGGNPYRNANTNSPRRSGNVYGNQPVRRFENNSGQQNQPIYRNNDGGFRRMDSQNNNGGFRSGSDGGSFRSAPSTSGSSGSSNGGFRSERSGGFR